MPSSITPSSGWYSQSHKILDHNDEDDDDDDEDDDDDDEDGDDEDGDDVVQAAQPGPDDPREAELLPDGLTLPL